jgi:hypothetical protein
VNKKRIVIQKVTIPLICEYCGKPIEVSAEDLAKVEAAVKRARKENYVLGGISHVSCSPPVQP